MGRGQALLAVLIPQPGSVVTSLSSLQHVPPEPAAVSVSGANLLEGTG